MKLNDYQRAAGEFALYKNKLYPFMALAEEAGEVAGKVAKSLRKTGTLDTSGTSTPYAGVVRESLEVELGDVLWQVQQCCTELGFTLEEVAALNLCKLQDREARDVIVGEGDTR